MSETNGQLANLETIAATLVPRRVTVDGVGDFLLGMMTPAEKAAVIDYQDALGDAPSNEENLNLCAFALSKGLTDDVDGRPFDADAARAVLVRAPWCLHLAQQLLTHNGLNADQFEETLEQKKTGPPAPSGDL